MPETASAMRLTAQARGTGTLHIREQAETGGKATFSATPSRSRGKGSAFQLGERSGTRAWERASRPMCDGHSPKILLISRSRERRNETRRPLMSLGYARLKPNPVGQQRLHSTIFPFGPPRIRPRKVSH